jgi:crotonobetainyl-CoA:carnitine CoA-transferase CaiB-like acyl-CoA transferase
VGELETLVENSRSRLSRTPAVVRDTIPTFGADTQWILSDLLAYDDDKITELVISGVLE